jgi:hypothetical protein
MAPTDVSLDVDPGARLSAPRRGPRRPIGPALRRLDPIVVDGDAHRFSTRAGGGRQAPLDGQDGYVGVEEQLERLLRLHEAEHLPASPPAGAGGGASPGAADWWDRLVANEPDVVRLRLEVGLGEHGFGAALLGVEGDRASVVLGATGADRLVGRWRRRAGEERPTRLSVPERHALLARICRSALAALAADVVALAPGVDEVRAALLEPDRPERRPAVIAVAALPRPVASSPAARDRFVEHGVSPVRGAGVRTWTNPVGSAGVLSRSTPTTRWSAGCS